MTEGNTAHVHHMLIYVCDSLNSTDFGGPCYQASSQLTSCLESGILIGAWAVGGEVMGSFFAVCVYDWYCFHRTLFFHPMLHMAWEVIGSGMQLLKCTMTIRTDYQASFFNS